MIRSILLATALAFAAMAAVSAAPPSSPNPDRHADVPPPPSIDDPGVHTDAPPPPPSDAPLPGDAGAPPDALAPLAKPDTRPVRDKADRNPSEADTARRVAESKVAIRKQGSDTVEEYRQHGHVWMIRIISPDGPVQTFFDHTGNGRLTRDPSEGPISPVYYTLYEWN